jgi:adenosylcobinamide-GDP ribazoletransferase
LADTFDALGGAGSRDGVLTILKDSRIGTFGGCALVISIVGRIALLDRLGRHAIWALPLVGCAARVGPVWQMARLSYVSRTGSKSGDIAVGGLAQALAASGWLGAAAVAAAFARLVSLSRISIMAFALALVALLTGWVYARRVGGVTGDFLGATEQLGELVAYAVLAYGAAQ